MNMIIPGSVYGYSSTGGSCKYPTGYNLSQQRWEMEYLWWINISLTCAPLSGSYNGSSVGSHLLQSLSGDRRHPDQSASANTISDWEYFRACSQFTESLPLSSLCSCVALGFSVSLLLWCSSLFRGIQFTNNYFCNIAISPGWPLASGTVSGCVCLSLHVVWPRCVPLLSLVAGSLLVLIIVLRSLSVLSFCLFEPVQLFRNIRSK